MIRVSAISKHYGEDYILRDFNFQASEGHTTVLVGPSGCGKTTLLRIICGLEEPDSGIIETGNERITQPVMRMVFQEDRLIPWATLQENLILAAPSGRDKKHVMSEIEGLIKITGLEGSQSKYPFQLSGGMRKRAALARGFISDSDILLLDEPLQAVDWSMKLSLVKSFARLREKRPVTTVFVTHDIQEAALLGDSIYVLAEKPMRVVKTLRNTVPSARRRLYDPGILNLEKEMFSVLLKEDY